MADPYETQLDALQSAIAELRNEVHAMKALLSGDGAIDGGPPSLFRRMQRIEDVLYGATHDKMGLVDEHRMLWKSWLWLLCTSSAGVGAAAFALVQWMLKLSG